MSGSFRDNIVFEGDHETGMLPPGSNSSVLDELPGGGVEA
jgi:hypothetical protein